MNTRLFIPFNIQEFNQFKYNYIISSHLFLSCNTFHTLPVVWRGPTARVEYATYTTKVVHIQKGFMGCVSGARCEDMKVTVSSRGVRKVKEKLIPQKEVLNRGTYHFWIACLYKRQCFRGSSMLYSILNIISM